jgi:hypothetical protein
MCLSLWRTAFVQIIDVHVTPYLIFLTPLVVEATLAPGLQSGSTADVTTKCAPAVEQNLTAGMPFEAVFLCVSGNSLLNAKICCHHNSHGW